MSKAIKGPSEREEIHIEILSEEFERGQQELCDKFKSRLKDVADEVMGELYCDVANHATSDAHLNYYNYLEDKFRKSFKENVLTKHSHFSSMHSIRMELLTIHKEELQNKIISDLQDKIKWLEGYIEETRRYR